MEFLSDLFINLINIKKHWLTKKERNLDKLADFIHWLVSCFMIYQTPYFPGGKHEDNSDIQKKEEKEIYLHENIDH